MLASSALHQLLLSSDETCDVAAFPYLLSILLRSHYPLLPLREVVPLPEKVVARIGVDVIFAVVVFHGGFGESASVKLLSDGLLRIFDQKLARV